MIKSFLDKIGIVVKKEEGTAQLLCVCPLCGKVKLYVNKYTGLWDCKRGCGKGNAFQLAKHTTAMTDSEVMKLLEQEGINKGTDVPAKDCKPSAPDIKKEEIRPATEEEMKQLCEVKQVDYNALKTFEPFIYKNKPIVLLPAYSPEQTKKAAGWLKIRLDGKPMMVTDDGVVKYTIVKGSTHGLFGLKHIAQNHPDTIILAEAWRDALAAIEAGYYATATSGGASPWNDKWTAVFENKDVIIIMDRDEAGIKAAQRRAAKIYPKAKTVKIVELPYPEDSGKDLHDYLHENNPDLQKLIDETEVYSPVDDTPVEQAEGNGKGGVVLPDDYPSTVAEAFRDWSVKKDVIHRYNSLDGWSICRQGQYQKVEDNTEIRLHIRKFLKECFVKKYVKGEPKYIKFKKQTSGFVTDVLESLAAMPEVHLLPSQKAPCSLDGKLNPNYIVPVENGLLDWSEYPYKLHSYTPEYYTFNYLPYKWEGEKDSELWIKFLIDVTGGDQDMFDLLQQWAGYCLMKHNQDEQKFLIVYGEGGTGKSVFVDVVTHLLGKENVSAIPLNKFDDPHHVIQTYGKMLNVTDESEAYLEEAVETNLKHYTGGTVYTFKRMYKEPFTAYPTAKIMIVTNNLPAFRDTSDGVWRRLLIAPFNHIIPEKQRIRGLAGKIIKKEMPGVLKWALEGARKIERYGFIIPDIVKEEIQNYRRAAIPEISFFEENIEAGNENDYIRCDTLRNCYKEWAENQGVGVKSMRKLGRTLKKMYPRCERRRERVAGERTYVYTCIKLQNESEFVYGI